LFYANFPGYFMRNCDVVYGSCIPERKKVHKNNLCIYVSTFINMYFSISECSITIFLRVMR